MYLKYPLTKITKKPVTKYAGFQLTRFYFLFKNEGMSPNLELLASSSLVSSKNLS